MTTKMRMRAVFDCSADDQGEISFKQGDVLVDVEKSSEDGWFCGRVENTTERGLFPYNYVERISSVETEEEELKSNLPGFPSLDAFEIAMSNSKKSSKPSTPTPPPMITSPKPKITVKKINTPPPISEKPTTVSRVRSYSTSATTTTSNKPDPTPVRPSQLGNGSTKSALELALSKGPSSNLRSNSLSSKQTHPISVPLVGMTNLKHSINNTDVEEEDGYQMIKPSQIRQKQPLKPTNSIATTSSNPVAWKKKVTEKPVTNLDVPVSSNPMPRLPSRPVSTASRKSRNSRSTSTSTFTSTDTLNKPSTLPAVKETEKVAPPILKPKPVLSQPHLPPRPSTTTTTKSRSISNPPPPIQPKPTMSSIEILLLKNAEKKSSNEHLTTKVQPPPVSNKPNFAPKQQASKTTLVEQNSIPNFEASRPSLDNWISNNSDANIKPSTLLNRARSQTNPTNNSPVDWTSMLTKPKSSSVIKLDNTLEKPPTKKSIPPPPPPSRQPKSKQMDQEPKHRYEILFESIQDDGYVDAETARYIWLKSKLSSDDLSRIWKECDVEHKGLLDKQSFMDGMTRIDRLLLNKQLALS
ncbi:hypothetical protein HPULCUR_000386 [Helicostylum pulchrum]|uniref:SH3 domain-containing protein n=1 Tax=Helicostylum pulchrum TaxID=562976 RepID=A0ABP9XLH2_9FUNG